MTTTDQTLDFEYTIIRTARRKTVSVFIFADNRVEVRAAKNVAKIRIEQLLLRKAGWIRRTLAFNRDKRRPYIPKRFLEGERFFFLGEEYPLRIEYASAPEISFEGRLLRVRVPEQAPDSQSLIAGILAAWYRRQAAELLAARTAHYAAALSVKPDAVRIKSLRRSWGNCTRSGIISYAWKLVMTPPAVIDAIVVHELCHLLFHNHSRSFWQAVLAMVPDYRQRVQWLTIHENALNF